MRIRKLVLRDYGLYRGEQTLDLAPRRRKGTERPVILVGGHNGAGKTTVLDAVRLCLYGRLALGARVRDVDYQKHLRDQVHRRSDATIQPSTAAVALEFDYARSGKRQTYFIERSWNVRASGTVDEQLSVFCDGKPLADVEEEHWAEFVRSLVPPGLSQLFFFDGEKIKRLAEEESEAETLAESVKALLGLDLVERLQADLDIYTSKRIRTSGAAVAAARLEELESRHAELSKQRDRTTQDLAQLRSQADYLAAQLEKIEQRLVQSGSSLAGRRTSLHTKKGEVTAGLREQERVLRELCEGPFVFALCGDLTAKVLDQLDAEDRSAHVASALDEVSRALNALRARFTNKKTLARIGVAAGGAAGLTSELENFERAWRETRQGSTVATVLHDLSTSERARLQDILGAKTRDAAKRAEASARELARLEKEERELQKHLNAAPDDAELQPLVRELSEVQSRAAEYASQIAQRQAALDAVEVELTALERERKKILEKEADLRKAQDQLALASRARSALTDYLSELTNAKVAALEHEAVECFNLLCRKDDLVRTMSINPRDFHISLKDARGRDIRRSELSAGEKQLYAVALLWGLARVSGRPLPMIIDTPLGRLDSIHRQNLIDRYFPHASHQVVILSTDTEVDQGCFETLRPHTSHALRLTNHRDGWTEIRPGYFWKEDERGEYATASA